VPFKTVTLVSPIVASPPSPAEIETDVSDFSSDETVSEVSEDCALVDRLLRSLVLSQPTIKRSILQKTAQPPIAC